MILDQAGWHGSNELAVPANVTLVPLPAYSPELNAVERVWLYLKERFLSHRLLDDYDAIVDAACQRLEQAHRRRGQDQIAMLLPLDLQRSGLRLGGIRRCRTICTIPRTPGTPGAPGSRGAVRPDLKMNTNRSSLAELSKRVLN